MSSKVSAGSAGDKPAQLREAPTRVHRWIRRRTPCRLGLSPVRPFAGIRIELTIHALQAHEGFLQTVPSAMALHPHCGVGSYGIRCPLNPARPRHARPRTGSGWGKPLSRDNTEMMSRSFVTQTWKRLEYFPVTILVAIRPLWRQVFIRPF